MWPVVELPPVFYRLGGGVYCFSLLASQLIRGMRSVSACPGVDIMPLISVPENPYFNVPPSSSPVDRAGFDGTCMLWYVVCG